MTAAGRRVAVLVLALAAVAVALAAGSVTARASSPAGEAAAAAIRARLGPTASPTADREAVLAAWEAAGARLDGVRRDLAAHSDPSTLDGTVRLVADLCPADPPPAGAALEPGELLLYREAGAAPPRWRVGMVTGWATAAILDPRAQRLEEVAGPNSSTRSPRTACPGSPPRGRSAPAGSRQGSSPGAARGAPLRRTGASPSSTPPRRSAPSSGSSTTHATPTPARSTGSAG